MKVEKRRRWEYRVIGESKVLKEELLVAKGFGYFEKDGHSSQWACFRTKHVV